MRSFVIAAALFPLALSLRLSSTPDEFKNPLTDAIYSSYEDYVHSQNSKTKVVLAACQDGTNMKEWVKEFEIKFLADYMKDTLKLPFNNKFGLTHGTRCGKEQEWFMTYISDKMKVLGTELSPEAKDFPYTVVMDFHDVKKEWIGHTDFVYSNALDHSYNPKFAIQQWMSEVASDGVLILHWKDGQAHAETKFGKPDEIKPRTNGMASVQKVDIYGGGLEEYQQLIRDAGNFEVITATKFPKQGKHPGYAIFARHIK